ncbi:MAG: S-methyl-5'-thioadenosine phosphorylase [Bacteroidota bacterium]|nr:S-methyl-5'-thioadenosine phosphorylase [Bacteroidota bacterium]
MTKKLGIIGGSGLEDPDIMKKSETITLATPYGPHSDITVGEIQGAHVALLSRHNKKHNLPPTQVNNPANLWALKELGCEQIIASTAAGSLREEIKPGDLVFVDQFIDFTRLRKVSFYESFPAGDMKHTPMADPFDNDMRSQLIEIAKQMKLSFHDSGTIITIEGPRFSTKAESHMFRAWGADLINMSIAPEAILTNEIGIPYAVVAMSTDYDCWKEDEKPVSWEAVLETFNQNVHNVLNLLLEYIRSPLK